MTPKTTSTPIAMPMGITGTSNIELSPTNMSRLFDQAFLRFDSLCPFGPATIIYSMPLVWIFSLCERSVEYAGGDSSTATTNDWLLRVDIFGFKVEFQLAGGEKCFRARIQDVGEWNGCAAGNVSG